MKKTYTRASATATRRDVLALAPAAGASVLNLSVLRHAAAAGTDAYNGDFSGCHVYAGGPGNTRILERVSLRFRCEYTGFVRAVRWWNRMGAGYSSGSGGKLVIEIRDDVGGLPGLSVLSRSAVIASPLNIGNTPQTPLSAISPLQANKVYHIVFINAALSEGYTSLNNLHCKVAPAVRSIFPFFGSDLATLAFRSGSWRLQPIYIPIFDLSYVDGVSKGQGWVMGGRNYQNPIGGDRVAEQQLIVSPGRRAAKLQFCLYQKGSGGAGLNVEMTCGSTTVRRTVPPDQISYSTYADSSALQWASIDLDGAALPEGNCTVRFSSSGEYWAIPMKNGKYYGWTEDKLMTLNGGCRYSKTRGSSWMTWPAGAAAGKYYNLPVLLSYI